MSLISLKTMLDAALTGKYAVAYFEAWNQDSLESILSAAEETDSPIIIGFGAVTANQEWFNEWGLGCYAGIGRAAVERSKVPVCFILNEVTAFEHCVRGIELGFNIVMLDSSHLPFEEHVSVTAKLVTLAHAKNVAVEAELGRLPEAGSDASSSLTDVQEAIEFVERTRVDALAVSIGNVHLMTEGKAEVDLDLLNRLRQATDAPLVIHGGSGFPIEAVKGCIAAGVAKFNVGTVLKQEYCLSIRSHLNNLSDPIDVQGVVGSRKESDFAFDAKLRIKAKVKELLEVYGSIGRAKHVASLITA